MMDFVRGRAVSRYNASDHDDGYTAVEAILRLAKGVDSALADPVAVGGCGLVAARHLRQHVVGGNDPAGRTDQEPAGRHSRARAPTATRCSRAWTAPSTGASGWAYSISMASQRIAYYECGNGENDQGYHSGSGMTYLYDKDNGQYADAFWPTVDRYRLPGITVDKLPLAPKAGGEWGAARPTTTWVGGSTLDGYAAIGQDLQGPVVADACPQVLVLPRRVRRGARRRDHR